MAKGFVETWNDRALKGWNEWKRICSIFGCSFETNELLSSEVTRATYRKLCGLISGRDAYTVLKEGLFWEENRKERDEAEEEIRKNREKRNPWKKLEKQEDKPKSNIPHFWSHQFDEGIIEKTVAPRKPKNYKDYVWNKIEESEDPPLQVIRGILIGPQGIINDIIRKYLRENNPQLGESFKVIDPETGKKIVVSNLVSIQQEFSDDNDDDKKTLEDYLPGRIDSPYAATIKREDYETIKNEVPKLFDTKDMILLLTHLSEMAIYDPVVLNAVDMGKSAAYARLNQKIMPRLCYGGSNEFRTALRSKHGGSHLRKILISLLKPEIGATEVLSWVEQEVK